MKTRLLIFGLHKDSQVSKSFFVSLILLVAAIHLSVTAGSAADENWKRHVIDNFSRGADGVRLADANQDGLLDITTGWEEGGYVRVYLNPGSQLVRANWPAVTVGQVASPEDAVFADLNSDGMLDVVSSCEGKNRTVYVHWAPSRDRYLDSTAWKTEAIPATARQHQWMYALPLEANQRTGIGLILGSKSGTLGWLCATSNPSDLSRWEYRELYQAGWTMSLVPHDMNRDGRPDVLISDRKGKNRGVFWLEHPSSSAASSNWQIHSISTSLGEVMFLDVADINRDGRVEIVVAAKPRAAEILSQGETGSGSEWKSTRVDYTEHFGTAKAVRGADLDLDGEVDLAVTCEEATGPKSGVFYLKRAAAERESWRAIDIAGPEGVKFDRIELLDLDQDGDLDLITCEERDNLGVIWYENPTLD